MSKALSTAAGFGSGSADFQSLAPPLGQRFWPIKMKEEDSFIYQIFQQYLYRRNQPDFFFKVKFPTLQMQGKNSLTSLFLVVFLRVKYLVTHSHYLKP